MQYYILQCQWLSLLRDAMSNHPMSLFAASAASLHDMNKHDNKVDGGGTFPTISSSRYRRRRHHHHHLSASMMMEAGRE